MVYSFHQSKLSEFNEELNTKTQIKPFSEEASQKIHRMYFVFVVARIYLASLSLAIYTFVPYNLYIALSLNAGSLFYCAYTRPYSEKSNNIRLITQ